MENNASQTTRKIKICHVINNDFAARFLLISQLKFLLKEGYDVFVVCSDGKWIPDIEKEGIKVKTIKIKRKISPLYDLITLYKLWNYFKKEKFQIVHTHTPKIGVLGQLAAKIAGVPIIINTIHGLYFHDNSPGAKKRFFILMEKIAASYSNLIFSQNKEDIDTLIKEKIAKPEKIKYLGNGIDVDKFNSERFSEEIIFKEKKELNIPAGYKVLGIVARLVREKGYLDLFKALGSILKIFPKTILLVIGPEQPEKKDAINSKIIGDYGIGKNVIFLGERDDVDRIYPLMDVFVLPSYREGFPRSILEAMAEKRPVVASDIRGCREEIESGKDGVLVPTGSPEELAKAVIYFFENPEEAKETGKNGRIKVIKEFDEKLVFERINRGYKELIKEKINEGSHHGN